MKGLLSLCILGLFAATLAQHNWDSIDSIYGVWSGPIDFPFIVAETEKGINAVCVNSLTQECRDELPPTMRTVMLKNYTITLNSTRFLGVTTKEKAAELYPACAKSGIFPLELRSMGYTNKIVKFDSTEKSIRFVNPRRPNTTNCMFLHPKTSGKVSRLTFEYTFTAEGSPEEKSPLPPLYTCKHQPGFCQAEYNEGRISIEGYNNHTISCIGGACLNGVIPSVGSKFRFFYTKKFTG